MVHYNNYNINTNILILIILVPLTITNKNIYSFTIIIIIYRLIVLLNSCYMLKYNIFSQIILTLNYTIIIKI